MNQSGKQHQREVALFRHGLVSIIRACPTGPERTALIAELAAGEHRIPGSTRTRVAVGTLRDWIRKYERNGFEGLEPKGRIDCIQPRRMSVETSEILLAIKRNNPELSVRQVIARGREDGELPPETPLSPATVYRLFAREGLMEKEAPSRYRDMRRFEYPNACDLWQADVMHGPQVPDRQGRKRRTYLIAIIDDATRVIPFAEFAFSEKAGDFLHVLREAIVRRGLPVRLYTDNGSNFRSQHLALVCARLGIALLHARPYHAAGKGKIERWFRTCRRQLLDPLGPEDLADLETLNRRTRVWIEQEYHRTPHRGLDGMTPLDRWAANSETIGFPDPGTDLDLMFMNEVRRKVSKSRTITLNGRLYEVPAGLMDQTVVLRFDPKAPPERPLLVHDGDRLVGQAMPLDLHANSTIRRDGHGLRFRPDAKKRGDR